MTQNQKEKFVNNNQRRSTGSRKRKNFMNLGFLISLVLIMILGSSVSYIFVKNDLSVKGFVINDLQKKVNLLNDKKRDLELELMSIESYGNIAKRVENLGMVKAEKIEYIEINNSIVAKR